MAIYFFRMTPISRAKGHSVTAKAAYNAAEKIKDERTKEIHDYRRKSGIEKSFIVVPGESPKWAQDKSELWNKAEEAEIRSNARVGRELLFALPCELDAGGREEVCRDFALKVSKLYGVACDVAIHKPPRDGDDRNHHAHIIMSSRRMDENGFTEKTRELDDRKKGPEEISRLREEWAISANKGLEKIGAEARIDHRSLDDEQEAQIHLGKHATQLERQGVKTEVGDANREIQARNQERSGLYAQLEDINRKLQEIELAQGIPSQAHDHDPFAKYRQQSPVTERDSPRQADDPFAKYREMPAQAENKPDNQLNGKELER